MEKTNSKSNNRPAKSTDSVRRSPRIAYNTTFKGLGNGSEVKKEMNFKESVKMEGNSSRRATNLVDDVFKTGTIDPDDDFVNPPDKMLKKMKVGENKKLSFYEYVGEKIKPRVKHRLFHEFLTNLTNEQKKVVSMMGFGSILDMSIANIPTGLGYWLVRNYDHGSSILNLGDRQVKITETLVQSMLGIPRGSTEIVETLRPRAEDEVVRRWRSQFKNPKGKLCPIEFMEFVKTQRDVGWHFKMNFLVAIGTYMGDITGNNTVNQKFLPAVRDIDRLGEMNWCRYLITVMRRRREIWNESKEYNGSMILLAYAYANSVFNCVVENGKKLMAVKVLMDGDLTVLQDKLEEKRLRKVTIEKSPAKVVTKKTNQYKHVGDVDAGKKVAKFTKKELAKMVIRKHTKKTNQEKKFVEPIQQEDGDKVAAVQSKQDIADDNVAGVESDQHQEVFEIGEEMISMPTQTDEEERAERITDLMQYFDNVYGDICRQFEEAHDEVAGSLLIKELEIQWKKNLARYTGKPEDETGNTEGDGNGVASPIVVTQRTWDDMERLCAKYDSGSIKTSPQKKKVSFSVPAFNLESGVKKDYRDTLAVVAKGKRVAEPDWEVNTPKRPQRFKFLTEVYCSPHAKRAVSLKVKLTKQESNVSGFVFAAYGNHCTEGGASIRRVIMETLRPDNWVHVSVMSAWASVLNHEEAIRSKFNTVHRLFCPAVMLLADQYEKDLPTRIGLFNEKMGKHLETQRLRSIVGVDVVLIPIINTKHFYLMAFNLKTHQIFVIDNMGTRGSFKFMYKGWPEKMRETFAGYLVFVNHPDASKVKTATLTRVDIPWASKSNHIDCGVFMMRHMENFKGCVSKEWFDDCGLSAEVDGRGKVIWKQKAELNDLRRKYVAKMLLSEINLTKDDFVQGMMVYDGLSFYAKMELEKTAPARIIERLKLC